MMYQRKLIPLLIGLSLVGCGGGGGGGSSAPQTTALSGKAVKGVIANGDVAIYTIASDGTVSSEPIATDTTDSSGQYSVTLPSSYNGEPLKVVITAGSNTTMKCDVAAGCGDVAFGNTLPLDSGFSLRAVSPGVTGNTASIQVSALTEMATALAETGGSIPVESINNANSQVQNLFGIPGDINTIELVDVTDPTSLATASSSSVRMAVISSGILGAVLSTDESADVETGLANFVETFEGNGGQLIQNDNGTDSDATVVSLMDIIEESNSLISEVETTLSVDLGSVANDIETQIGILELKDDNFTTAAPSDTANASELAQAKALVSDIRDIANSSTPDSLGNFGENIDAAFAAEVETTGQITGMGELFEGVGEAATAISEASSAYFDAAEEQKPESYLYQGANGVITVSIADNGGSQDVNVTFSIDQTVEGITMDVSGTVAASVTESETPTTSSFDGNGTINLSGNVSNTDGTVTISTGTIAASASSDGTSVTVDTVTNETYDSLVNLDVDLSVTIAQNTSQTVTNPVTFVGTLSIEVNDLSIAEEDSYNDMDYSGTEAETISVGTFNFSLSGTFSDTQSNSYDASFSASIPSNSYSNASSTTNGVSEVFPYYWEEETSTDETADNFLPFTASISFEATINGVSDDVLVTLNASRTTFEQGTATITISMDGKTITVEGTEGSESVTITNQDDVSIVLSEDVETQNAQITAGSIVVADIEENEEGLLIITYIDDTFETL